MEAVTAGAAGAGVGTGSKTIADLLPLAAEKYGDAPAQRHKSGDEWVDVSVRRARRGRARDLARADRPRHRAGREGLDPREHPARVDQRLLRHPDRRRGAGHDLPDQLRRGVPVRARPLRLARGVRRGRRPAREDPRGPGRLPGAAARDRHGARPAPSSARATRSRSTALRERGAGRDAAEWKQRYEAVTPDDVCLFIYTSGTTGPPKGCLLSHGNYRAITDAVIKDSVLEDGDSAYLFLPLAHAFAILIQFTVFELGVTLAYWSSDPKQIIPDLTEVKPSYFPSVPRMFEKIYTLATNAAPDREQLEQGGGAGREGAHGARGRRGGPRRARGRVRPGRRGALQERARAVRRQHPRVRDRRGADRARRSCEFFYACGVPVMEGYGMTETSTSATVNRPAGEQLPLRLGRQARRTAWR